MRAHQIILGSLVAAALTGCLSTDGQSDPSLEIYAIETRRPTQHASSDGTWSTGPSERIVLRGRVEDIMRNTSQPPYHHLLVHLRLPDGRVQIIDLGPERNLPNLRIDTGVPLTAHGRMGQSHGRWVLTAERLEIDGQWHAIPRAAAIR